MVLCAGVEGPQRSAPVVNNSIHVFLAPPNRSPHQLHSLALERDFLSRLFVKMTDPNRINKASIFTWLLAGRSHMPARNTRPVPGEELTPALFGRGGGGGCEANEVEEEGHCDLIEIESKVGSWEPFTIKYVTRWRKKDQLKQQEII